jgi:Nitrogen regulatory protein PII
MAGFDLICCVVKMGEASKVMKVAGKYGVKNGVISIGRGAARSRILEFLKIDEVRKEIIYMMVETELASEAIKGISEEMSFAKPDHGIAFSYSVSEFMGSANGVDEKVKVKEGKNSMYKAIYVVVDKGNANSVIEAANKAGARGGTVVNARGSGTHEAQKLFSIEIEPEKEKVFIIAKNELKDDIIEAIKNEMKIDEPGNGIIFVLDVNEAYGLQ